MKKTIVLFMFVFICSCFLFAVTNNTITDAGTGYGQTWDDTNEQFTRSDARGFKMTWDDTNVYIEVDNFGVDNYSHYIYFSGPSGTTTGKPITMFYEPTTPILPFNAQYLLHIEPWSGGRFSLYSYDGEDWDTETGLFFNIIATDFDNQSRTVYVPFANLGNQPSISFCVFSSSYFEWIGGYVPSDASVSGDPRTTDSEILTKYIHYGPSVWGAESINPNNPSYTLPVTLSTFTAEFINNTSTLYWETQSEVDNLGWNVYRNVVQEFSHSEQITHEMIPGNGTITEPSYYNFEDAADLEIGQTYYYWLESIDYSGISQVYSRVAQITIPDPSVNPPNIEPPIVYDFKNIPNPISGSAKFQFTLDKSSMVSVSIYNILGELVQTLPQVMTQPDETAHIYWNGKNSNGKELTPGVYFYNLIVNGKTAETKKLILMK